MRDSTGVTSAPTPTGEMLIDNEWRRSDLTNSVYDKFTGELLASVSQASREDVGAAVAAAQSAMARTRLSPYERYQFLDRAATLILEHKPVLTRTIVAETGFTLIDAQTEVDRCVQTLILSSEEAKRIHGDVIPIHGAPGQDHRLAFTIRSPVGVVCAITPFNSPLNTVAHKAAPALAAGNAVVIKPASSTPLSAELFCRILQAAGAPEGYVNLVHGRGSECGTWLLAEQDVAFYAFTGSTEAGMAIQAGAGLRKTQLELGSIAGTIVCHDADLDQAVERCVRAAFRKAGQVCTSVQRLYVDRRVADPFVSSLADALSKVQIGDPRDPSTFVGPMISEAEAQRAETWIEEAREGGAETVTGGTREASLFTPTVLTAVDPAARVMREEVFAPVVSVVPFENIDEALVGLNATRYGLAAGIFTSNIDTALSAARLLEVGTVNINESSSARVDLAPYGGMKDSGHGKEGPRFAIREMTNERLITVSLKASFT